MIVAILSGITYVVFWQLWFYYLVCCLRLAVQLLGMI